MEIPQNVTAIYHPEITTASLRDKENGDLTKNIAAEPKLYFLTRNNFADVNLLVALE